MEQFILYLTEQIGEPYLWGGQHTKLTPDNYVQVITKKETSPEHIAQAIKFCEKKFSEGYTELYAYDCSGLGMYYLQNVTHILKRDMTANGMMKLCEIVTEPKKGYWVFRIKDGKATHIGYMVSDTEVIHAKGREYGVVREKFKPSYWDRIGKPNCFDFDPDAEYNYEIEVRGSVRVREGNGLKYKKICTVKNCRIPYLGQAVENPCWYLTIVKGQQGYITSNPRYTSVVEVIL